MEELMKLDLYDILGVLHTAEKKEILKAYRKRALKCHPDKNPDNPKAVELFHQLTQALELLTDDSARDAYDKILKAKKAAELRNKELDSKRKKFKEDLEARERAAETKKTHVPDHKAAERLKKEIERLRKEGSRLVEEEQERMKQELAQNTPGEPEADDSVAAPRLKLKWKAKKGDETNGGYDRVFLQQAFSKYGEIAALLVSSKRNGSAVLEFASVGSAVEAVEKELGLAHNPLTMTWLSGKPCPATHPVNPADNSSRVTFPAASCDVYSASTSFQAMTSGERDFEDLVFMRMRQAQERKRLAEEMAKEDETELVEKKVNEDETELAEKMAKEDETEENSLNKPV